MPGDYERAVFVQGKAREEQSQQTSFAHGGVALSTIWVCIPNPQTLQIPIGNPTKIRESLKFAEPLSHPLGIIIMFSGSGTHFPFAKKRIS